LSRVEPREDLRASEHALVVDRHHQQPRADADQRSRKSVGHTCAVAALVEGAQHVSSAAQGLHAHHQTVGVQGMGQPQISVFALQFGVRAQRQAFRQQHLSQIDQHRGEQGVLLLLRRHAQQWRHAPDVVCHAPGAAARKAGARLHQ